MTREHLFWNHGSFGVQSIPEVFHEIPVKKEFLSLIRKLPFFWQLFLNCHFKKLLKSKNAIQHDQISTKNNNTQEKNADFHPDTLFFYNLNPKALLLSLILTTAPTPAQAESKRVVGEIPASGFIFKDATRCF